MRSGRPRIVLVGLLASLPAGTPPAVWAHTTVPGGTVRQAPGAARPAIWRTYDMIVDLTDLPRTYTCDELWYEFRGILLRLGAPPSSLSILPYRCSPSADGYMPSPRVEIRFQMPFVVGGPVAKMTHLLAVQRTIRFQPGKPKTLKASDCQLLEQIDQTLFDSLPVKVADGDLHCGAQSVGRREFSLTVRAWVAKTA